MKLSDIKPQEHGTSDKYSWNLYAYLNKYGMNQRILWDEFDGKPLHPMNIYVLSGYSSTIGVVMQSVMACRSERYDFYRYPLDTYTDITEEFWKNYIAKGRCMFDERHTGWWQGGEHRYQSINRNSKRCRWCGAILRRNIVTTKVIKRTEKWTVVYQ